MATPLIFFYDGIAARGVKYTTKLSSPFQMNILSIPPPAPVDLSGQYKIENDPSGSIGAIWTAPTGKIFGGWKLTLLNGTTPSANTKTIYMPGEIYSYAEDSVFVPIWNYVIRTNLTRVDSSIRSQILSGNTFLLTKNDKKNKLSSGDILNMKKARASRSFYLSN